MFKIETRSSGFLLTFSGFIEAEEMKRWVEESEKALKTAPSDFGVIVDMRALKPLPADSKAVMESGQKLYKMKGMKRSFVAVNDAVTAMQFKKIAKESGIYLWERYIDASTNPEWQKIAVEWVKNSIDPDK